MNRLTLRDDLVAAFTPEEFAQFCDGLGFSYVSLGGRTHSDKVSSFIGKVERNSRLPDLLSAFALARPEEATRYQDFVGSDGQVDRDTQLAWLDGLAAGEGQAIEEPPTMKWDSSAHSPDKKDE